jgi:RimJ/RimL family protein N-acetyltransferase
MYNDHVIGVNEHFRWISRLKTDESQIVFGILDEVGHPPLGVVSLNALDVANKRSDWAFYLEAGERISGLAVAIERQFIDFAFETVGLEKLSAAVLEGNLHVVGLHKKFGFEEEGFRSSEIIRNGKRIGLHLLGLQKDRWMRSRAALDEKYRDVFEQFAIGIHWSASRKSLTPIDQIEAARARNNVNWMNILRIAVEKSPTNARQIIAEIKQIDEQISSLTAQLSLEP